MLSVRLYFSNVENGTNGVGTAFMLSTEKTERQDSMNCDPTIYLWRF